jgi:hypothetical protein
MVTQDVDLVVATQSIGKAVERLEAGGFASSRFEGSVDFEGGSKVSLQFSTGNSHPERCLRSSMEPCSGWPRCVTRSPEKSRHGKQSKEGR